MTHILITDLREIRYMAYVPEEIDYEPIWNSPIDFSPKDVVDKLKADYQSELEKAKRESIEFDRPEDREKITMAIFYSMAEQDNISPGIYQVPVEVEVESICDKGSCAHSGNCYAEGLSFETCAAKKVARIVQPKEPKPIDVDTLLAVKEALGEPGMNEIKIVENSLMPDNLIVVSTKIFNQLKKSQGKEVNQ